MNTPDEYDRLMDCDAYEEERHARLGRRRRVRVVLPELPPFPPEHPHDEKLCHWLRDKARRERDLPAMRKLEAADCVEQGYAERMELLWNRRRP